MHHIGTCTLHTSHKHITEVHVLLIPHTSTSHRYMYFSWLTQTGKAYSSYLTWTDRPTPHTSHRSTANASPISHIHFTGINKTSPHTSHRQARYQHLVYTSHLHSPRHIPHQPSTCTLHRQVKQLSIPHSCNNVGLLYFTIRYLPGRATIP